MAHYTATVPTAWTREQTFDYLADFRNFAEWDPSMEESALVDGAAGNQQATYQLTMSKKTQVDYTAVEVQRPERIL